MADKSTFEVLNSINVNDHTDNKNNLTYLSWAWAWAEFKKVYPEATYKIWRNENGLPYIFDPNLGYMVFTSVTVGDLTHEMWLPVMDNKNNAMKNVKYKVTKGRYSADVEPANMFDVNTAIMRCLTKNLAMFGLGLYIYAGEDLPEDESTADSKASTSTPKQSAERAPSNRNEQTDALTEEIAKYAHEHKMTMREIAKDYGLTNATATAERLQEVLDDLKSASTADSKASTDMPDFAAIDEPTPFD